MIQRSMTSTRTYLVIGSLLVLAVPAALFARTGAAADTLRIFDWSDPAAREKGGPTQSGLAFVLSDDKYYTTVAAGAVPGWSDNLPIAAFGTNPPGTTDVAIHETPAVQSHTPNAVLYLRAAVRYRFNGHLVYLSTAEPVMLGKEQPLSIGRLRETTDSGRALYVASEVMRQGANREISRTFNQVTFVENGLIVTLASELPQEQLIALIKTVEFNGR